MEESPSYRIIFKDSNDVPIPPTDSIYKTTYDNIYRNLEQFEAQAPESFKFSNGRDGDGYYFIQIHKLENTYGEMMIKLFGKSDVIPQMAKSYLTDMLTHAKRVLNT